MSDLEYWYEQDLQEKQPTYFVANEREIVNCSIVEAYPVRSIVADKIRYLLLYKNTVLKINGIDYCRNNILNTETYDKVNYYTDLSRLEWLFGCNYPRGIVHPTGYFAQNNWFPSFPYSLDWNDFDSILELVEINYKAQMKIISEDRRNYSQEMIAIGHYFRKLWILLCIIAAYHVPKCDSIQDCHQCFKYLGYHLVFDYHGLQSFTFSYPRVLLLCNTSYNIVGSIEEIKV